MPIKFKCKCGHILTVPDKAAGKSGKCPKCQQEVRVPVPKSKPAAASAPAAARAGTASSESASGLETLFDDAGLTQKRGPVCSTCGAAIKPGARVCTQCGWNFETGEQLAGFNVHAEKPEFDNLYLNEAAQNMRRELAMDDRREKSSMPWWVIMSFLIGAMTLCAAGVVIIDGLTGTPADPNTFIGKVQALPVFATLGTTALITGSAIVLFAHLSICMFAFARNAWQGVACFFLPLLYSIPFGIMSWKDNKAPIKAIMMALVFIGLGVFLIIRAGGFELLNNLFS